MVSTWHVVCLTIIGAETVVGIAINIFMVVVNLLDWTNGRSINSVDIILIMLALVEILFQITICVFNFLMFLCSGFQGQFKLGWAFSGLFLFLGVTTFWFSTCLSVFYCLRIVDFKHPVLRRLKMRLPEVIRHLLVWGAVISLIVSAPAVYFFLSHEYNQDMMSNLTENGTHEISAPYETSYFVVVSTILGFCFPFFLGVASSALIIRSLYRHKRNMEQNLPCFNKPHLEAHVKAAKSVVSQLFIYMFFFLMAIVTRQNIFQMGTLEATMCWMGLLFTLSVAPTLLIMGNTKLRRASERLLLNLQELSWF